MRTFRKLLIAVILVALAPAAFAAGRTECARVKSAIMVRNVDYCALLPPSYDQNKTQKYPILYYLHGLGGNAEFMVLSGGWNLVEQLQSSGKIGEFIIVTPSAGASFYINSKSGKTRYEDFLIKEFIPAIEKKLRVKAGAQNRAIGGVSMGGYGALRFGFKYPQMFSSVSGHMSALAERLPKALIDSIGGLAAFGTPFDSAFWEQNTPFTLARKNNLNGLKIYFDCGSGDEYGFDVGNRALSRQLESQGVKHESHIYPGGHGWRYVSEHLDESMIFHSRAFGLTK